MKIKMCEIDVLKKTPWERELGTKDEIEIGERKMALAVRRGTAHYEGGKWTKLT